MFCGLPTPSSAISNDLFPNTHGNPAYFWSGVLAVSALIGFIHIYLYGNLTLSLVLICAIGVVVLSLFRPAVSFYLFLILTLSIEQLPRYHSWTFSFRYFKNLHNIDPSFSGISISPMEIHLLCIIAGTIIQFIMLGQNKRYVIAWAPMLIYAAWVGLSFIYGLSRGGDFLPALWEIRGLFYLFLLALLVPQLIRTERQVGTIIWIILCCLAFRAIEVSVDYISAGFTLGDTDGWGNHEDAGFFATTFVFLTALLLFRTHPKQRQVMLALLVPFVLAFVASGRRTVFGVVVAAMIVFFLMLSPDLQRRVFRIAWKLALVMVLYLFMFWNSEGRIGYIARSIRTALADDPDQAGESYSSNLYRKAENYNLTNMVLKSPIIGSGYGIKVDYSAVPMPLFWDLGFYIPHNQLFGVAAKTGIIGFIIFWFFYLSTLAEVTLGFRAEKNPYFKAVFVLVSAVIVNHLVYSYFDIMLTYYRTNVYLGTFLGIASVMLALQRERSPENEDHTIKTDSQESHPHWIVYDESAKAFAS